VYGEELNQTTAMWWSPDSTKLAYYRFDEKEVQDYYLQLDQTKIQSTMDVEAYPKAGTPNPVVDLFVYDVASGKTTKVDVRSGQPFDNAAVGHYVYRIAWSPDGSELLFNRTNRRQQILEFVAANPSTGATRVILREEWPTGWVRNSPPEIRWLSDGKRFIWESERTGWATFISTTSRQAHHAADDARPVRDGGADEGGRAGGRDLLPGAQRRQPHEGPAAPRRVRWQITCG
jgi:dipeptidyl-peptidase 4